MNSNDLRDSTTDAHERARVRSRARPGRFNASPATSAHRARVVRALERARVCRSRRDRARSIARRPRVDGAHRRGVFIDVFVTEYASRPARSPRASRVTCVAYMASTATEYGRHPPALGSIARWAGSLNPTSRRDRDVRDGETAVDAARSMAPSLAGARLEDAYERASVPARAANGDGSDVLGAGNFGTARLMRRRRTGELVAVKFIERGAHVDENVKRELVNHRGLTHPNVVGFIECAVTDKHLAIVLEYASGGELFDRVLKSPGGHFAEAEGRYFFQQLISGVAYCHAKGVAHRDLKLENALLDGGAVPRLKICDFGYSKNSFIDSDPKSTVGTPAYIAPEVLERKPYDGKTADVWSCGVTLFVMLCGKYPFEDRRRPRDFRSTIVKIRNCEYEIPRNVVLSPGCVDLIKRIFVVDPQRRIDIPGIQAHPWFVTDLPLELVDANGINDAAPRTSMTVEDILAVVEEAKVPHGGEQHHRELEDDHHDMVTSGEFDDDDFDA